MATKGKPTNGALERNRRRRKDGAGAGARAGSMTPDQALVLPSLCDDLGDNASPLGHKAGQRREVFTRRTSASMSCSATTWTAYRSWGWRDAAQVERRVLRRMRVGGWARNLPRLGEWLVGQRSSSASSFVGVKAPRPGQGMQATRGAGWQQPGANPKVTIAWMRTPPRQALAATRPYVPCSTGSPPAPPPPMRTAVTLPLGTTARPMHSHKASPAPGSPSVRRGSGQWTAAVAWTGTSARASTAAGRVTTAPLAGPSAKEEAKPMSCPRAARMAVSSLRTRASPPQTPRPSSCRPRAGWDDRALSASRGSPSWGGWFYQTDNTGSIDYAHSAYDPYYGQMGITYSQVINGKRRMVSGE
jgi:hypothetical protein